MKETVSRFVSELQNADVFHPALLVFILNLKKGYF